MFIRTPAYADSDNCRVGHQSGHVFFFYSSGTSNFRVGQGFFKLGPVGSRLFACLSIVRGRAEPVCDDHLSSDAIDHSRNRGVGFFLINVDHYSGFLRTVFAGPNTDSDHGWISHERCLMLSFNIRRPLHFRLRKRDRTRLGRCSRRTGDRMRHAAPNDARHRTRHWIL